MEKNSDIENNYLLHKKMKEHNISLIYAGDFNQEIAKSVLSMTEKNFDSEGVDSSVKKKVFNIMVEALQNICKHQQTDINDENTTPIFIVGNDEEGVIVISGNPILNSKIQLVKDKIDKVNSLDKEGLKQFYKEARLNSTISEVGGAGLGFIDMARKSENKLDYSFEYINDSISFFILKSKVLNAVSV